jgi:signal transduction histidine kinase
VPLRLADVDLDEVVSAEVARLEAFGRHTITAKISAVRVQGDGEKLARVLRNIADNASRHTRDRLDFAITVDADRRHVSVTVSDNGPGIADADKSRVLQRFVRLDTVRERSSGGSGLGLAIVDEIVRAHHGSVTVADAPGGGAVVGFRLPVAPWVD